MTPLDLTTHAPRSPRVKIGNLYLLARTIDKLRALQPGGNIGSYKIPGFSGRLLEALGVSEGDLLAVVVRVQSEEDVVAWVHEHSDPTIYDAFNEKASHRAIQDVDDKVDFFERYPHARELSPETPLFDMLILDDAANFPTQAG